jgi:phage host-nuclease inhibitor protein Gam
VSLDTKRKKHKERFESAAQHRYRLYQALSHDGNVQYERGKILEKELQDKEAETEAEETRILDALKRLTVCIGALRQPVADLMLH